MGQILLNAKAHGKSAGAALTQANSADLGTPISTEPVVSGTGTVTFQGTDHIRFNDPDASSSARVDWIALLSGTLFSFVIELNSCPAPSGGEERLYAPRNVANTTDVIRVQVLTDRTVRVYDGNGTSKWTSTAQLPASAGSRIEGFGNLATGQVQVAVFSGSDGKSTTPDAGGSSGVLTGFAWNGATDVGGARIGAATTAPSWEAHVRNFRMVDSAAVFLGPLGGAVLTSPMTAAAVLKPPSASSGRSVSGGGPMTAHAVMLAPVVPSAALGLALEVLTVPAGAAPQVGVTVTGLHPLSPSLVTVRRSVDGDRWDPVRGLHGRSAVASLFVRDHEAPLNVPTTYRLDVDGPAVQGGVLEATITVPSVKAWIQDPLNPRSAVAVSTDFPGGVDALRATAATAAYAQVVDMATPTGSDVPVGSVGVRQRASKVPLVLDCDPQDSRALHRLLMTAGEVVVRGLPSWVPLEDVATVVVENLALAVVGMERHRWTAEATQVAASSLRLAVPWWTWRQLMDAWPGAAWADLMAARPGASGLDWMRNPEG